MAGEVPVALEPVDVSHLHRDGQPQDAANAGKRQQPLINVDFN
jgi:hypothetical protein